jgi:hypothetical protein
MNQIEETFSQIQSGLPCSQTMTHFHLYENLNFISELNFDKERITIGRSRKADLFLDHQSVADIHAYVNFKGERAILTNRFPQNGLRLNGMPVRSAPLKHEDVIVIGPFALKVQVRERLAGTLDDGQTSYAVRLVNRYGSAEAMHAAAANLAKLFRTDLEKIKPLMAKKQVVVKKGLHGLEAAQFQNALLKAGIICDVQLEDSAATRPSEEKTIGADHEAPHSTTAESALRVAEQNREVALAEGQRQGSLAPVTPEHSPPAAPAEAPLAFPPGFFAVDEEADENGDIWEAPFSLNQILTPADTSKVLDNAQTHLQVVKTIGNAVVDAASLARGQAYRIEAGGRRVKLVRYLDAQAVITLPETFDGVVLNSSGVITADLNNYKTETHRSSKNRSAYEIPLPADGAVLIGDGACQYRIDRVQYVATPPIAPAPAAKALIWKHWAVSLGLHCLLLGTIALITFFQTTPVEKQKLHFVKIDQSMLQQMEKPIRKPEPKQPTPPKPETREVKQSVKPPPAKQTKPNVKKPVSTAKRTKEGKKVVGGTQTSKHPKAGGGFGNGNIKNRDINQTGLLGALGGPSGAGPSPAMVAVTNLDAVTVPGATEKNFSVGGLKGSLGNGKISVATGQIVQTKGSSQVLRSGGARGKGEVAALERGTTGKKKVQGMVTAKMNRTVKIEGGMSREMVKRVIDQHLDEITYCYETALMSNPSILGRIVFEWKILKDGSVGEIRIVASSVNSNQIHGCIKSAIKSWQFPKPVGAEVIVSYPFVFDLVSF